MSIGDRFHQIRRERKLRQTDVAEAIGISHGALVGYEKSTRDPPASAIAAFSRIYKIDPRWLLLGEGRPGLSDLDEEHRQSIKIAWTHLARAGDEVTEEDLTELSGALFQYLCEHGDITDQMKEKIFMVRVQHER